MSFRNLTIVGLLSCVALQSAFSQDADRKSLPGRKPAAASPIPTSTEPYPALPPFVRERGDTSPDALFSAVPAGAEFVPDPALQQISHKIGKVLLQRDCVGPSAAPDGCAPPAAGCAPPAGPADCADSCLLKHRHAIFADYLFLSATGVDMPYALPVDGLGPVNVLQGTAAIADTKYDSGFRVGGIVALDDATSVMGTFWWFQSSERDSKFAPGGGAPFYQATLTDPGTLNVAADSLFTQAFYDVDFEMIDLVVRRAIVRTKTSMFNAVAGVRYGHLNQLLRAQYFILGETTVDSDIDFYGVGPRLGLEGEYVSCNGFLVYGNTHANFLPGTFEGDYRQSNAFTGTQSFVKYDDVRVVTQLELELGVGWQSKSGRFRFTVGYYLASWHNAVTQPVFIRGVQRRQLEDLNDRIGFNGLTARAMIQF